MKCPKCGGEAEMWGAPRRWVCKICGHEFPAEKVKLVRCGHEEKVKP